MVSRLLSSLLYADGGRKTVKYTAPPLNASDTPMAPGTEMEYQLRVSPYNQAPSFFACVAKVIVEWVVLLRSETPEDENPSERKRRKKDSYLDRRFSPLSTFYFYQNTISIPFSL